MWLDLKKGIHTGIIYGALKKTTTFHRSRLKGEIPPGWHISPAGRPDPVVPHKPNESLIRLALTHYSYMKGNP